MSFANQTACYLFCFLLHEQNFLALCASGYYDGTEFHRNIKGILNYKFIGLGVVLGSRILALLHILKNDLLAGFMVQGGDPTGSNLRKRVGNSFLVFVY